MRYSGLTFQFKKRYKLRIFPVYVPTEPWRNVVQKTQWRGVFFQCVTTYADTQAWNLITAPDVARNKTLLFVKFLKRGTLIPYWCDRNCGIYLYYNIYICYSQSFLSCEYVAWNTSRQHLKYVKWFAAQPEGLIFRLWNSNSKIIRNW